MNRSQLVTAANVVQSIRPDWQQPGIIAQLERLDAGWTGTDAALIAHAVTIAGMPSARTPAAFTATPPTRPPNIHPEPQRSRPCFICGNTKRGCRALRDFEIDNGIPDPHIYETAEEAEAERGPHQLGSARAEAKIAARQAIVDAKAAKIAARAAIRPTLDREPA
jgi:hypothetical protein